MKTFADTQAKAPTEPQSIAINSLDRSMAIVAGAGSGKTHVLIERCLKIIGNDWSQLDHLLAITFTEKAAAELKARLRTFIPQHLKYKLTGAWIGTFHACSARILRQNAPLIGLDPSFSIMDENASGLAARRNIKLTVLKLINSGNSRTSFLIDALDFRTTIGILENLMRFRWHARTLLKNPKTGDPKEKQILDALSHVYAQVESNFLNQISLSNALDFEELEILTLKLLENHPEVLKNYRHRFKHLLIDEFQDTSDVQTELVLKLFDPKMNKLCIVGDPRQSIYRFRGANIDCFATALEAIHKNHGNTIHLAHNFRSDPQIIEFINRYQQELPDGLFGKLTSDGISPSTEGMIATRKSALPNAGVKILDIDLPPDTKVAKRRREEAQAIASFVASLVKSKQAAFGDIVCLFQALTNSEPYEIAFRRQKIPFRFFGGRGLLERQEIMDLLAALCVALDPTDEISLLGLLRSPLIGLSDDDLVILSGPNGDKLIQNAKADPRCRLIHELASMARHLKPSEILKRTLKITGYETIAAGLDPSGGMTANMERFISMAMLIERQEPTPLADFTDFIKELKKQSARLGDPPAAGDSSSVLQCMSVHAAKGLEFPVVILPDLFRGQHKTGGFWQFVRREGIAFKTKDPEKPFGQRIETPRFLELKDSEIKGTEAESKRLLYVAMTRARDTLVLPIHKNMKKDGQWHRWLLPLVEKSESVSHIKADIIPSFEKEKYSARFETIPQTPPIETVASIMPRTFSVSQLECFDRCPQEYFLKYVLNLPASTFFREHQKKLPANVTGSIVHAVLKKLGTNIKVNTENIIKTECILNNVPLDMHTLKKINSSVEIAKNIPIIKELASGEHEIRFDWNVGGNMVTGFIDWLKQSGDGFDIVDFKTDSVKEYEVGERAKEYDLQLVCYALATEAATNKKIRSTTLLFLTPSVTHTLPFDDMRRNEGMKRIEKIMKAIIEKNFDIKSNVPPCFKCPYHNNAMCWEDKLG